MPTTTCRSSYRYHITLRTYNLSAHATSANESMRALRVYIFTDGASQRTYVFVAHVTVRRCALLHVHPTSHGTLVPCAPYQVAAWCREVHWLKSALAARDKVWACARASVMCASRFCLLCATTTVYAPWPRAQSGRADHTLQSMQAPSVAFTMGVEGAVQL